MSVFQELTDRGLIAQTTGEQAVREMIDAGKAVFYIGFDPTADSLHVGHFLPLLLMRHLQRAGNRPIALLGGGTTMVGDPTGRTDMRSMMSADRIAQNAEQFKKQIGKFIEFGEGKGLMLNNAEWLLPLNYIEFLRDIGVHFSVNRMLTAESVKSRMEHGLSFLEFNYMLMQSYDFFYLHEHYGVNMQCGGDDQWSNMLGGTELIRRKRAHDAHALTITLLLTKAGHKMGKTMGGAVWLDREKTSPFDFYQYFRNVDDADVIRFLRMLTFVPLPEIASMEAWEGAQLNTAKERLAFELTALVHSTEDAVQAQEAARALFTSGQADNMPSCTLSAAQVSDDGLAVLDLLVLSGMAPSKKEARRLIEQGGIEINEQKIGDFTVVFDKAVLADGITIKKGKKSYLRVVYES